MGCDIHVKTYLWSKVENRYIDLFEVLESWSIASEHTDFPDIVGDRHYDLFGTFGHSGRSYYPAMDCLYYGFPPFLRGSTLEKFLTEPEVQPGARRSGSLLPERSRDRPVPGLQGRTFHERGVPEVQPECDRCPEGGPEKGPEDKKRGSGTLQERGDRRESLRR